MIYYKAKLLVQKHYLSVIQHFSLGGVGFKAQDSFSFVKLIFNSPRIHLFMATCGRGGIDMDTINSLTLSLPHAFPRRVFHKNTEYGGMALLWDKCNRVVMPSATLVIFRFRHDGAALGCTHRLSERKRLLPNTLVKKQA